MLMAGINRDPDGRSKETFACVDPQIGNQIWRIYQHKSMTRTLYTIVVIDDDDDDDDDDAD